MFSMCCNLWQKSIITLVPLLTEVVEKCHVNDEVQGLKINMHLLF